MPRDSCAGRCAGCSSLVSPCSWPLRHIWAATDTETGKPTGTAGTFGHDAAARVEPAAAQPPTPPAPMPRTPPRPPAVPAVPVEIVPARQRRSGRNRRRCVSHRRSAPWSLPAPPRQQPVRPAAMAATAAPRPAYYVPGTGGLGGAGHLFGKRRQQHCRQRNGDRFGHWR